MHVPDSPRHSAGLGKMVGGGRVYSLWEVQSREGEGREREWAGGDGYVLDPTPDFSTYPALPCLFPLLELVRGK